MLQTMWVCDKCYHCNSISRATCEKCGTLRSSLRTAVSDGHKEEIQMQHDHGLDADE